MHRFYADGLGEIGSLVTLSEEDARHASRVLRMQPGDAAAAAFPPKSRK